MTKPKYNLDPQCSTENEANHITAFSTKEKGFGKQVLPIVIKKKHFLYKTNHLDQKKKKIKNNYDLKMCVTIQVINIILYNKRVLYNRQN